MEQQYHVKIVLPRDKRNVLQISSGGCRDKGTQEIVIANARVWFSSKDLTIYPILEWTAELSFKLPSQNFIYIHTEFIECQEVLPSK